MIWDRATLARLGELCWKHHVTVISDEIHCDLTDPGYGYVPFASAGEHCAMNSVTCLAPTKTFNIAGLHTAAVMAPDPVLRHKVWRGLNTDEVAEPNAFAVDAAIAAFGRGGEWLDALRAYLADNKREAHAMIDAYNASAPLNRQVRLLEGHATYLMWLDCSAFTRSGKAQAGAEAGEPDVDPFDAALSLADPDIARDTADSVSFADTDGLCDYLRREHRVFFSPGAQFGGDGRDFIRINVATQRARMREGLRRLTAGLEALR